MAFPGPGGGLDLPLDLLGMPSMDAPDEFVSVRGGQRGGCKFGTSQVLRPELPHLALLQVDQFFGSYVSELNSRSKRSHELGVRRKAATVCSPCWEAAERCAFI